MLELDITGIDLSHLVLKEVDNWGNLTEYGVLKIKQRTAARKARNTIRRRYHTEFEWVKPEFPIYSERMELVNGAARDTEQELARKAAARSMEVHRLDIYGILRQRIAAL